MSSNWKLLRLQYSGMLIEIALSIESLHLNGQVTLFACSETVPSYEKKIYINFLEYVDKGKSVK